MDESDAAFFGFECVFEAYFPSVYADRAAVGFMDTRKDVHKVDLPAPFSPIRAWISPDFKVRSTPFEYFVGAEGF